MPRPQEPKERPYHIQEVVFPGGAEGVMLAGEVTMPQTAGPFPAVILIEGLAGQAHRPQGAGCSQRQG